MSYSIDTLALEITRRCNMRCRHCLRGGSQRADMSEHIIDHALNSFEQINNITFTGGEPFLNPRGLLYALDTIALNHICVSTFYLVTNGRVFNEKIMDRLMLFYESSWDKEACQVKLSRDRYHKEFDNDRLRNNIERYEEYPFFYLEDERHANSSYTRSIIPEGRGKQISRDSPIEWIDIKNCDQRPQLRSIRDGDYEFDGTLYVNVLGDICGCANLSYISQKKFKLGRYDAIHEYLNSCDKTEDFEIYPKETIENDGEGIAL